MNNTASKNTVMRTPDGFVGAVTVGGQRLDVIIPCGTSRADKVRAYLEAQAAEKRAKDAKDLLAQELLKECGKTDGFTVDGHTVTVSRPSSRDIDAVAFLALTLELGVPDEIRAKALKVDVKAMDGLVKGNVIPLNRANAITEKKAKKPYVVVT